MKLSSFGSKMTEIFTFTFVISMEYKISNLSTFYFGKFSDQGCKFWVVFCSLLMNLLPLKSGCQGAVVRKNHAKHGTQAQRFISIKVTWSTKDKTCERRAPRRMVTINTPRRQNETGTWMSWFITPIMGIMGNIVCEKFHPCPPALTQHEAGHRRADTGMNNHSHIYMVT